MSVRRDSAKMRLKSPCTTTRCPCGLDVGHRMAAKGMEFPWRWTSGVISPNLDVIWGMSVQGVVEALIASMAQPVREAAARPLG